MKQVTDTEIRASFVNCTKGEATRANLPRNPEELPWDDLDFLGWVDPGAPERAYLVVERDGRLIGIALRVAASANRGFTARSMCSICMTTRTGGGVTLMTARRAGESGRQGNSVGQYICSDLACSLYVRDKKRTASGTAADETLDLQGRITRAMTNLDAFLGKILSEHA